MSARLTGRQWIVLCAVALALLVFWSTRINDDTIYADAGQNLWMALNLERVGMISLSETAPYKPTMIREPLPIFVGALAVRAVDSVLGPAPPSEYFYGKRAELLKYQNIFWLSLLSATLFVIGRRLGLAFPPALLCVLLGNLLLLNSWYGLCNLNSLLTESAAAALLTLASLMLAAGVGSGRLKLVALAGICFGLSALVKASFLYVTIGLGLALPVLALLLKMSLRSAAAQAAVLVGVTVLVVLPWMFRNEQSVGYFEIAGRAGEALHDRSVMDLMTRDEYLGSFYAWAPYPFGGVIRRVLGYSKADMNEGGRLQRLNESSGSSFARRDEAAELAGRPQDTLTYFRFGRAQRVILVNQFAAAGNPQPDMAADHELKKSSMAVILQHPLRHAALSLALLWRGGNFGFLPLAVAFVHALRRRQKELALIVLPSLALVLFYTLTVSFETRYAMPTYPIVMCLLVALVVHFWSRFQTRNVHGGI